MITVNPPNPLDSEQPHFWVTDSPVQRGNDYELSLPGIVAELTADDSPPNREALNLIFGNAGYAINWGKWNQGERDPVQLFQQTWDGMIREDEKGRFLALPMEAIARVLIHNPDPLVKSHIRDYLKKCGLTPNMERITKDFCPECAKRKSLS